MKIKKNINYKFYKTQNFEVHCFCQIILDNVPTNYFFVGGFNSNSIKGEGIIKLYILNLNKNFNEITFEYLQDIIINKNYIDFKGFQSAISCITQSLNGNILITCWDGNVYLFSPPNIDKYLKNSYNILVESQIQTKNEKIGKDIYIENNESFLDILNSKNNIENGLENFEKDLNELKNIDQFYVFKEIINNSFEDNKMTIQQILDNSIFTFYTNKKGEKPFLIFKDIFYGYNYNFTIKYSILKECIKTKDGKNKFNSLYGNFKAFLYILEKIENKIEIIYENNYKLILTLCFKTIKEKKNSSKDYIICNYLFHIPNKNYIRIYQTNNILVKGLDQEFYLLLDDINDESYKDIEYNNSNEIQDFISFSINKDFNSYYSISNKKNLSEIFSSNSIEKINSIRALTSSSKLSNNIYDIYEILLRFNEILKKKIFRRKNT